LIPYSPSIISLEDADHEGHSWTMLRRVAAALGKEVIIKFVDAGDKKKAA
jgi:hypothetical protein